MLSACLFLLALLLGNISISAQNNITGTVTDTQGEPLTGASVLIKGTQQGVSTDIDGNFAIKVAQGKTLVVSYIGYITQEVPVNSSHLDIVLKEDQQILDEVVVGYGTMQRTGFAHNHNLSISGGGKSTSYNVSVNYIARDGVIKGVGNNLFTARSYVETKTLKDRLTLAVGVNGNVRNEWGVPRGDKGLSVYNAMYYYSPLVPVRNKDGTWYKDLSISQNVNPMALIYEDDSRATFKRFQVTGEGESAITDIVAGFDKNAPVEYFNLQGVKVNVENAAPGLYIVKQGKKVAKQIIR